MTNLKGAYAGICDAVAKLLEPHAEVVLHDLATDRIAYIANSFSKRRVGDNSLNDREAIPSLSEHVIGPYPKTNWDGRPLKSVTTAIRDAKRRPIGLLCINYDVGAVAAAMEQLSTLFRIPENTQSADALVSKDWREAANSAVGAYLRRRKSTLAGLTSADMDDLIADLDGQGIFQIRNAVSYLSKVLNLSRATIYNRLASVRRRVSMPGRKADSHRQAKPHRQANP